MAKTASGSNTAAVLGIDAVTLSRLKRMTYMWDARQFIEDCIPGFERVTSDFEGYDDCGRRTRLRAYAHWGFVDVAGEGKWTNPIEHEVIDLLDRELNDDSRFLEYWEAVTGFASYVLGALTAKQHLGQLSRAEITSAHVQLATYDMLNMEEIHEIYDKAKYNGN